MIINKHLNDLIIEAVNFLKSGKLDKAEINYKKILKLDPKNIHALNNLGNLLFLKDKYNESIKLFDKVLKISPSSIDALMNKAICLTKIKKPIQALNYYQKIININPNFVKALYNQGNCLQSINQYKEAISSYQKAIKIDPMAYMIIYNYGISLQKLGLYEKAIKKFKRVIEIKKDFSFAYNNLGNCLKILGNFQEAMTCYKKSIKIRPDDVDANYNLGQIQLLLGNYDDGWANYEWRKKLNKYTYPKINNLKLNNVKNLKGKSIYISKEQGLGDYIQFCRYLPLIEKLEAKIILDTPKALLPMINSMNFKYIHKESLKNNEFDYHFSIGSLPLAFGTSLNTIPNKIPYFFTPKKNKDLMKLKINENKINIGLKWRGNRNHWDDENRSINLSILERLFDLPYEFHSLEIEYLKDDEIQLGKIKNLHCHKNEILGFENTAGLIESMDLIISVDTSITHLCGAINKPVWLLLSFLPDFRWLLDRNDSPWYPSVKLYRQINRGNWDEIINRVKRDLDKLEK